ncbi:hypothetical protein K438DRAFT_1967612 [Mycena galopus ATCC 62051]|nr:hypothetical protein K438DRAFT_1967612 [Mycena galopus ATCC 62051]
MSGHPNDSKNGADAGENTVQQEIPLTEVTETEEMPRVESVVGDVGGVGGSGGAAATGQDVGAPDSHRYYQPRRLGTQKLPTALGDKSPAEGDTTPQPGLQERLHSV